MSEEQELAALPCPFCGRLPIIEYEKAWIVGCFYDECTVGGSWFHGAIRKHAVKQWNTRAPDHKARADRAEAALRDIAIEAERENGGWVHLKRSIAINARAALEPKP